MTENAPRERSGSEGCAGRVVRAVLVLSVSALALAVPADAGVSGKWDKVTGVAVPASNTDRIGVARTADGVLHVAWMQAGAGIYDDAVLHTPIGADGKAVGAPNAILAGFELNRSVDLLTVPGGGLRVFFAGLKDGHPLDNYLSTATAGADGKAWALQPFPASNGTPAGGHPVYAASGIGAGLRYDGTPVSAWGDSSPSGGAVHVGLSPTTPDSPFSGACCETDPDVASSAEGTLGIAWNFLGSSTSTIVRLSTGQQLTAPQSAAAQLQHRVAISGRIGAPGLYLAYTSGTNPFTGFPTLWRVGDPAGRRVSNRSGAQKTAIAAAPGGRMWVLWARQGRLYAARSNAAATRFGAIVTVKPPAGTQTIYDLAGEGSRGPLDMLALIDRGGDDRGFWHQRVLPGLALAAKPKKVGKGGKVTFTVTDAGAAVGGASVKLKLKGKTVGGKTSGKGKVKLAVPKGAKKGSYKATATKKGYAKATVKVGVK